MLPVVIPTKGPRLALKATVIPDARPKRTWTWFIVIVDPVAGKAIDSYCQLILVLAATVIC